MAFLRTRAAVIRFGFAFLLGGVQVRAALGQSFDEYQVKAAFLFNFAKFVEWPPRAFKSSDPIAICVFGEDPFGNALDDAVKGKTIEGHSFGVLRIQDVHQSGSCQILFVSASERKRVTAILGALNVTGILTVGETEGFAEAGGVINFKVDGGRLRLEINVEAAERAKLRLSSKLLSLAQIVKK